MSDDTSSITLQLAMPPSALNLALQLPHLRAVTIQQPYTQLAARGDKEYETRGWPTTYRGWLLLHAGAKEYAGWRDNVLLQRHAHLKKTSLNSLPLSGIVGIAWLQDCIQTTHSMTFSTSEQAFGDLSPGRYAWQLSYPLLLPRPIRVGGAQQLWKPGADILAQLPLPVLEHLVEHRLAPAAWPAAALTR